MGIFVPTLPPHGFRSGFHLQNDAFESEAEAEFQHASPPPSSMVIENVKRFCSVFIFSERFFLNISACGTADSMDLSWPLYLESAIATPLDGVEH